MVALNQVLADGANALIRVAVRQAIDSSTSTPFSAAPSTATTDPFSPGPTSSSAFSTPPPTTTAPSSASFAPTTTALGPPSPTPTGDQGGQGNNSPLLFFVALGFGVVFTNLWIIVGVKYCFRYNARNRQLRGLDENGEPINLDNMPQRPHRRRREKKLMTMDEVNEKFPMTKYKTWVSSRAREGLPTAGGVSVHPSRANSVRSVQGIVPEMLPKERDSVDERPQTAAAGAKSEDKPAGQTSTATDGNSDTTTKTPENGNPTTNDTALTSTQTIASIDPKDHDRHGSDDEDDDEHINAALPPEMLEGPGDTCAICIDTLEDDDDVRGLTCGHAFHAVCLDPWLTNRRACCPLCKADYYTPKPRPPPIEGETTTTVTGAADPARNNGRMNMPRNPTRSFNPWSRRNGSRNAAAASGAESGRSRGGSRVVAPMNAGSDPAYGNGYFQRFERQPSRRQQASATQGDGANQDGLMSRLGRGVSRFNMPRFGRSRNEPTPAAPEVTASGANGQAETTPSQLEAGVRPTPAAAGN
ncbi:uncharacterized protein B0I36DRAFT_364836 [Microdochium trichocladiopsis]|uniref:RING-type domain-containing protein n=1 Tax=Microdochium trichocladiopsis TaxID=1682393 RepID=A0A9P8Y2H7_9PEZI|nr:uncharacterized protein B0I36DRAFT_364836 [Microdochium trichocladiopsis]KAH7027664.1 hypothetical protein B0I36DRAFT_364836 [Microdochium trichocladiopsis]